MRRAPATLPGPAATARMFSRRGWAYPTSTGKLALGGAIDIDPYISQFDACRERLTCLLQTNGVLAKGNSADVLAIRTNVETLHDRLVALTNDVQAVNPTWDQLAPATIAYWQAVKPSGFVATQDANGVIVRTPRSCAAPRRCRGASPGSACRCGR